MRVPGRSSRRSLERRRRLTPGVRNMVTTDAGRRSYPNRSAWTNVAIPARPSWRASVSDCRTRLGSISTPVARMPNRLQAAITMRPSPEPRSISTSAGLMSARSSIASTTFGGVGTSGTSVNCRSGCAQSAAAMANPRVTERRNMAVSFKCRRAARTARARRIRKANGWIMKRPGWRDYPFSFHDGEELGPARAVSLLRLQLRRVIPLAAAHHQILAALHLQIHGVIQAVGLQRLGAVEDVVLMPQLVGDVLERLLQVFHLKWEEGLAAGFRRQVFQNFVAIGFSAHHVSRDRVDHHIGLLRHFERLVAGDLALVVVAVAD